MTKVVEKEVAELIISYNLNCSFEEFKYKVDWNWISTKSKLSEDFIREFKNDILWKWVSTYQILSLDFIKEFKDKVNLNNLLWNKKIPKDIKKKIRNETIFKEPIFLYTEINFNLIDIE